ncbi:DUF6876 family protein [uncultured Meiothermus sp.]|jgi:hypothetical protein|uniref:DUF6876 family protein n=1 Tax=uncultured Meiothermus sp. TaxID=157471 RepID=UPI00261D9D41|nr:DUF6876 family protein [uncultured Meiothermus sp.]
MSKPTDPKELAHGLGFFTGTLTYTRHWCGTTVYLTDGAKYLAEKAEAYWLMDIIASAHPYYKHAEFVVVELVKTDSSAVVTIKHSPSQPPYYTQHIPYTDFPLEYVKLYAALGEGGVWVVMLPSEN